MREAPDPAPSNLEGILEFYANSPHHQATGITVVSVDVELARMRVPYNKRFVGDPDKGALHGGLVTTMMDATGGLAVLAQVPAGTSIATLDLRLDYLRTAAPGLDLIGEVECFKVTTNIAFTRGTTYEENNAQDPIANFIATYMIKTIGIKMATGRTAS